jgi:hypothetical protein
LSSSNSNSSLNFITSSNSLFNNSISDSNSQYFSNSLNLSFNPNSVKNVTVKTKLQIINDQVKEATIEYNKIKDKNQRKLMLPKLRALNAEYLKLLRRRK